jgi:iron complex outermembrane receptor protein
VRGRGFLHPATEVVTYFDGVPRYGFIYGQSMADGIPLNAIGQVEVYKSPQPVRFGTGYALINISPRAMEGGGWLTEGGFSGGSFLTFSQNAAFGIRLERFDILAAQSWMSTDGHVVHSGANQQSYYVNTGFLINPNWELRLLGNFVVASTEQAPRIGQSHDDILSSYRTNSAFSTLTLNNHHGNTSGYLKLYYNNTQFQWLDEHPRVPGVWSLQSLQAFGAKARQEFTVLEHGTVVAGMDLDWKLMVNESHAMPTVITTFPAMILYSPYIGAAWRFDINEALRITPSAGARGFFHSVWANQLAAQTGLAVGWHDFSLHLDYSRGLVFPAPAVIQSLLRDPTARQEVDLKGIRPETVDHFEAGLSFSPSSANLFSYTLDGSYFYNYGNNRIIIVDNIPGNASSASSFSLHGFELAGSVNIAPRRLSVDTIDFFAGAVWYANVRATDEDGNTTGRMPFTPDFSLSAGFRWAFLNKFNLSGDFKYLHNFYGGGLSLSPTITPPAEVDNLRDIYILNLRLGFNFARESLRLSNSEVFFSVNNVFNHQYEYFTGYLMPGVTFMTGFSFRFR